MGTPRINDRIDKVHDESNSRYELASMVVELQEEVADLTIELDAAKRALAEMRSWLINPNWISIGSIDNIAEIRINRQAWQRLMDAAKSDDI